MFFGGRYRRLRCPDSVHYRLCAHCLTGGDGNGSCRLCGSGLRGKFLLALGLFGSAQLLFDLEFEIVRGLAELVEQLADLTADFRQLLRTEDDERDHNDQAACLPRRRWPGSREAARRVRRETRWMRGKKLTLRVTAFLSNYTFLTARAAVGESVCRKNESSRPIRFILTEIRCNTLVRNRGNVRRAQFASYATDTHLL